MNNWKHIKDPDPTTVPLTCTVIDRDDGYTCWVDRQRKIVYWVKKPWYESTDTKTNKVPGRKSFRRGKKNG